jgi:hypothetical protein
MADFTDDQLRALGEGIAKGGVATEATLKGLVKALGGDVGMAAVAKATGKTAKEMKSVGTYLNDLSEDLEDTSQGLTKMQKVNNTLSIGVGIVSGNLSGLGSSVKMVGEQFGLVGSILGDTLGYLVERLSENVDFYRQISQIGGTAGQSISNLRVIAGKTGLSMSQLTDAVVQAGGNLALLGGTTGKGVKDFTDAIVSLSSGETFERFSALGFTMNEIAQSTAEYLELQTQLGRTQRMDAVQLATETSEYLNNLDLLSRLTGKNRQALQQEMQERAKDNRLSLQMSGMTLEQQREINSALSMTGNVNKAMEQSIRDLIATDGVATNAREAGILAIDGMREAIHGLARGESGSAMALMTAFQNAAQATGEMSQEDLIRTAQLKRLGVDFEDVRFETLGFKNVLGDLQQATKEQSEALKVGKDSALQFDRSTQRLRTAFQALLAPVTDLFSGAIGLLATAIEKIASGINFLTKDMSGLGKSIVGLAGLIGTIGVGAVATKGAVGVGKKALSYLPGGGGGGKMPGMNILKSAGAGGGSVLSGAAKGISAFAAMGPKILMGAGIIAGVVAILGAGVGLGALAAGKGLQTLAEGLNSFQDVDGEKLKDIASATSKLSLAMASMGAGALKGGVSGFIGKIFGGGTENFAKNLNNTLDELDKSKIDMYATSLENLGNAMTNLRSGMMGTTTASASATGDKLDQLNNTMEQILMAIADSNRYNRITSQATVETAENFG